MAKDDIEKNGTKPGDTMTPGGQGINPLEVALTGSMLGSSSVTSFEYLVVNTLAQIVYGAKGANARNLNDIKTLTQKNNPISYLEKFHKHNEKLSEKIDDLDDLGTQITMVNSMVSSILSLMATGVPVQVMPPKGPPPAPSSSVGGMDPQNPPQIELILKAKKNSEKVLEHIVELSKNDKKFEALAKSFKFMAEQSEDFKKFSDNTKTFVDSMLKIIDKKDDVKEFIPVFKDLFKSFDDLKKVSDKNVETFEKVTKGVETLSKAKVKPKNVKKLSETLADFIKVYNELDFKSLKPKEMDKVIDIGEKFELLTVIKDLDTSGIDKMTEVCPKINELIEEIKKVEKITKPDLKNLNTFIDFASEIDLEKIKGVSDEGKQKINNFKDAIPVLVEISKEISEAEITKIKKSKLTAIQNVLTSLDELEFKGDKEINWDKLNELNKSFYNIQQVFVQLNNDELLNLPHAKIKKAIGSIVESLQKLEELKYEPKNDVDFKKLEKFAKKETFKTIAKILDDIANVKVNKTAINNIVNISEALQKLETLEYNGKTKIDTKKLQKFIDDKTFDNLTNVLSTISKSKIAPTTAKKVEYMSEALDELSEIDFDSGDVNLKTDDIAPIKGGIDELVKIANAMENTDWPEALKNVMFINQFVKILAKTDTSEIEGDKFDGVRDATQAILNVCQSAQSISEETPEKLETLKTVVEKFFDEDGIIPKIDEGVKKHDITDEVIDKVKRIKDLTESVKDSMQACAAASAIAGPAKAGIKVMVSFIEDLQELINKVTGSGDCNQKAVTDAKDAMKGIAELILVATFCIILGGAVIVFFPKLVMGAFAFSIALGVFLFLTLGAISLAVNGVSFPTPWGTAQIGGIDESFKSAKDLAFLIAVSAGVMLVGAVFVQFFPELVGAAFKFSIILGAFLFVTLGAIGLAVNGLSFPTPWGGVQIGGINESFKNARDLAFLIAVCAGVMLVGAVFVKFFPDLVAAAFKFSIILGVFLFVTLGAIGLAVNGLSFPTPWGKAKIGGIGDTFKGAKDLALLIAVCAGIMILGAVFVKFFPDLVAAAFKFTLVLGLFIFATLGAINLATKGMNKAMKHAKQFAILIAVCAGVMVVGGSLFTLWPDLQWGTLVFTAVFAAFCYAVTKTLGKLGKQQQKIMKGAIALAIIAGVVVVMSASMLIVKKAAEGDLLKMLAVAGLMCGIMFVFALFGVQLGSIASNPFFWVGIAALAAISGMILIVSTSMVLVAKAAQMFNDIKKFDVTNCLNIVVGMIAVGTAMIPLGLMYPIALAASVAVVAMSMAISIISETIADVASLTIPIYTGTKKTGVRHLDKKDFKSAAENVKEIITVLGKTIIDIYFKNPQMFADPLFGDNPFTTVCKSVSNLGKVITKIAHAVKEYAELKIPIYSGTKVTGYNKLTDKDFESAANNVKLVVMTLAGALIDIYNNNPHMFQDTSIFAALGASPGNTPLAMVISVTQRIGKLMTSIAKGVQSMANLKLPVHWNKDGNPDKFEKMEPGDVEKAGNNVKFIVECLTNSLIDLYNANPKMYQDTSIFAFMGESPGNTPLSMVISVSMKLGKLMSSIAQGVQSIGNLAIPIKWNKDGKPIDFKNMKEPEITAAGENTKFIVETLSNALIEMYDKNPDMYQDKSLFSFLGESPGNTPLSIVIAVSMKLGKLISSIAEGVQSIGNLFIPTEWNKDGKPIKFRQMTNDEILQAAENTKEIVTVLGGALMATYEDHKEWFTSTNWLRQEKPDPKGSPFAAVIAVNMKLADIISKIGKAVGDLAKLQIATEWNKDGKAIKFRQLENKDFDLVKDNIGQIVTTLGNALMETYENHKDWFQNEDGDVTEKGPFAIVMKSCESMGSLIGSIAGAVKDMASLQIPIEWNKDGKAIKFRQLEDKDFNLAKDNICDIVTTLGFGLMDAFKDKQEWFTEETNWYGGSKGPSEFMRIVNGCTAMTEVISGIADGITAIAQLQIPTEWNKDGKPIKFRGLEESDFTLASENVGKVVTTLGAALMAVYDSKPEMFETNEDNPDAPFVKVARGCSYIGETIKGIAEGITQMANLEATMAKEGVKIDGNTYKDAADKVAKVVTVIGTALLMTFEGHKDWFNNPPIVTKKNGLFSSSTEVKPDNSDTPFQKVIKGCTLMGQMIIAIAQGISFFARITQSPLEDGSVMDIPKATKNIGDIITTIGSALIKAAQSASYYDIVKLDPIIKAVNKSALAVISVALMLEKIGTGEIPIKDKDGNIIDKIPLTSETINKAAETIGNIISGVSMGFENANKMSENYTYSLFGSKKSKSYEMINDMLDLVNKAIVIVRINLVTLARIGSGKLPIYGKDFSKVIETIEFTNDDLEKGATMVGTILTKVAEGVSKAYSAFKDGEYKDIYRGFQDRNSGIFNMLFMIDFAMNIIRMNLSTLSRLATGTLSIYKQTKNKDGVVDYKLLETIKFTYSDLNAGAQSISTILTRIGTGIADTIKYFENNNLDYFLYGDMKDSPLYNMMNAVNYAMEVVRNNLYTLICLANGELKLLDKDGKVKETIKFELANMDAGADTIAHIISSIAEGVGSGVKNIRGIFGEDEWKKTTAYMMLKAVEEAKNTVGKMTLFLSHLANNEYVYYDILTKKETTIKFDSQDSLRAAATTIGLVISSIGESIGDAVDAIGDSLGTGIFDFGGYEKSRVYLALKALADAKDAIGPFVVFLAKLASGEYTYYDLFKGQDVSIPIDKDKILQTTAVISAIIDSLSDTISRSADNMSNNGWDIFNSKGDKIDLMFQSLNRAVKMLGKIAKVVNYYGSGEVVEIIATPDGGMEFVRSGAPNVEAAKRNIALIIDGLTEIIKRTSDEINKIKNIDDTISGLAKSMKIINASIGVVNLIHRNMAQIMMLKGFKFSTIITPILEDINMVFKEMNNIGKEKVTIKRTINTLLANQLGIGTSSGFSDFLMDVNAMARTAWFLAASPITSSFKKVNEAITETMTTMRTVKMPENFSKQVEDLNRFVKVVNTIKIKGVDSLTKLLEQLNKLGINMGNLDKLTSAIANKLTIAINNTGKIMQELNKTMIEDGKRKEKHKNEIKNSVKTIKEVMAQKMEVIVKMDDAGGSAGSSSTGDDPNKNTPNNSNAPAEQNT